MIQPTTSPLFASATTLLAAGPAGDGAAFAASLATMLADASSAGQPLATPGKALPPPPGLMPASGMIGPAAMMVMDTPPAKPPEGGIVIGVEPPDDILVVQPPVPIEREPALPRPALPDGPDGPDAPDAPRPGTKPPTPPTTSLPGRPEKLPRPIVRALEFEPDVTGALTPDAPVDSPDRRADEEAPPTVTPQNVPMQASVSPTAVATVLAAPTPARADSTIAPAIALPIRITTRAPAPMLTTDTGTTTLERPADAPRYAESGREVEPQPGAETPLVEPGTPPIAEASPFPASAQTPTVTPAVGVIVPAALPETEGRKRAVQDAGACPAASSVIKPTVTAEPLTFPRPADRSALDPAIVGAAPDAGPPDAGPPDAWSEDSRAPHPHAGLIDARQTGTAPAPPAPGSVGTPLPATVRAAADPIKPTVVAGPAARTPAPVAAEQVSVAASTAVTDDTSSAPTRGVVDTGLTASLSSRSMPQPADRRADTAIDLDVPSLRVPQPIPGAAECSMPPVAAPNRITLAAPVATVAKAPRVDPQVTVSIDRAAPVTAVLASPIVAEPLPAAQRLAADAPVPAAVTAAPTTASAPIPPAVSEVTGPSAGSVTRGIGTPTRALDAAPRTALSASEAPLLVAGTTAPAFRLFAAAIHAARADESDRTIAGATTSATLVEQPRAPLVVGGVEGAPLDMSDRRWPQAMVERIERLQEAASATRDAAGTSIRLVPDALGTIDVGVRRDGNTLHVHFAAESAQTRALIADAQPRLQELAEARGLRLAQNTVGAGVGGSADGQAQRRPEPRSQARSAPASALHEGDTLDISTARVA